MCRVIGSRSFGKKEVCNFFLFKLFDLGFFAVGKGVGGDGGRRVRPRLLIRGDFVMVELCWRMGEVVIAWEGRVF